MEQQFNCEALSILYDNPNHNITHIEKPEISEKTSDAVDILKAHIEKMYVSKTKDNFIRRRTGTNRLQAVRKKINKSKLRQQILNQPPTSVPMSLLIR